MKSFVLLSASVLIPFALTLCSFAQEGLRAAEIPVSLIVTMNSRDGVPNVGTQNVTVYQQGRPATVTNWAQDGALELFILLNDSPESSYGTQLADLRQFIMAQPSTTRVGVAYLQMGGPKIVQSLTADHVTAAKALHPSMAELAKSASAYEALGQLIEQWPVSNARREILMISDGADETVGTDVRVRETSDLTPARDVTPAVIEQTWTRPSGKSPTFKQNPYVDSAIERAQRAGIIVFTICTPNQDMDSDDLVQSRMYLSRLAKETGGESYYYESGTRSLHSYLSDSTMRLAHQYLVTFLARAENRGTLQPIKVRTDVLHTDLVSAKRVYVPAAK